jgi:hypothetical protein
VLSNNVRARWRATLFAALWSLALLAQTRGDTLVVAVQLAAGIDVRSKAADHKFINANSARLLVVVCCAVVTDVNC